MSKTLQYTIFILITTLIICSINYYFWARLFRDTNISTLWKNIGIYSLFALTIYFVIAMVSSQFLSYKISQPLLWIAYFWLGSMMLLFSILLFSDVIKFIVYLYSKITISEEISVNHGRRTFFPTLIAIGATSTTLIASGISVFNYYSKPIIKKIKISLNKLPNNFKGFKIVQISDLHIGQLMTKPTLEKIVDQVNDLKPDLIAITGDLVDGSTKILANEISPLQNLESKNGVFFVTGNHEYYSGVEEWILEIEKLGVKVLQNENVLINKMDESICIVGINDHDAKKFGNHHAADCKKALSGLDKNINKILLAHQPLAVKESCEYGVDLVLAGHTHGGQIFPFNYMVYLQQPYLKGLYELENTKLYVNQGTGCWGPPMRLGSKNEITEITLI